MYKVPMNDCFWRESTTFLTNSQSQHRCHREGKLTHSTRAVCAVQTCGSRSTQRPVFLVFVVQTSGTFSKCWSAETVQPENLLFCLFVSLHFLLPPPTHTHIPSLNPCVLRKTEHSWHHQVKDVEQFVSCVSSLISVSVQKRDVWTAGAAAWNREQWGRGGEREEGEGGGGEIKAVAVTETFTYRKNTSEGQEMVYL